MTDTIAAISTAYGKGGIAVIRISGDEAVAVAEKMFKPVSGRPLSDYGAKSAVYGRIYSRGKVIDDGVATIFRAPSSYTGEDTVELSCHGGIYMSSRVLSEALVSGARMAEAGEFTRRAFLSGKMTLTEAEAVIDLIDAKTDEQISLARSQVSGRLSAALSEIYEKLKTLVSSAYVYADYPDEDLADVGAEQMKDELAVIEKELVRLTCGYEGARIVREGINTVLVGRPNTGKSSVLNRLLGCERAIVSDIAGTTRDTIEESVKLGHLLLNLTDTAGIHGSDDKIEKIGVERSVAALERADLVLAVFDGSEPLDEEDKNLIGLLGERNKKCPKIALVNKSDLDPAGIEDELDRNLFCESVVLSAASGEGFDRLTDTVERLFEVGKVDYDSSAVIANARQNAAVSRALAAVRNAESALDAGFTPDVAGIDLEEAMQALGETDGRAVSADIVDAIFHRFCVGK